MGVVTESSRVVWPSFDSKDDFFLSFSLLTHALSIPIHILNWWYSNDNLLQT